MIQSLRSTLCKYQNDLATTGLRNGSFLANKPIWKERSVDYEAVWLFLLQCAVVAKTLIEFEFVAQAWICYESLN